MAQTEHATILLVDDDPMNRELMQTVLERWGYRMIYATNGAQALEIVLRQRPALVLCDVRMAGLSGYEVCMRMKADPRTAAIPFIILTAYDNDAERSKAEAAGADVFHPKMKGWPALLERMRALLSA